MGIIRLLLAIAVVCAHSPWRDGFVFTGGQVAVQGFFLMSGFLVAHVLTTTSSYTTLWRFYANRYLRLYPIYSLVAIITLPLALSSDPSFHDAYHQGSFAAILLLSFSNIFLLGQDWIMFTAIHKGVLCFSINFRDTDVPVYAGLLLPQAWTLGVELSFYALAPLLVRRKSLLIALFLISIAIRTALLIFGLGSHDPWSYRFFPTEIGLFIAGVIAYQHLLPWCKAFMRQYRLFPVGVTVIFSAFTIFYCLIPISEAYLIPAYLLGELFSLPFLFEFQNSASFDRKLGRLSYPTYIVQSLAGRLLRGRIPHTPHHNNLWNTLAEVSLSLLLAVILNTLIEQPVDRIRAKLRNG